MPTSLPTWSAVAAAVEHAAQAETVLTHGAARAIAVHRALATSALDNPDSNVASARAVVVFLLTGEVAASVGAVFDALWTHGEYDALSPIDRFVADMFHAYLTARITGHGTMDTRPLVGWGEGMALTR